MLLMQISGRIRLNVKWAQKECIKTCIALQTRVRMYYVTLIGDRKKPTSNESRAMQKCFYFMITRESMWNRAS